MKGAFLKIHYLECEQDERQYFHSTVSQTVFQALIIYSCGRSSSTSLPSLPRSLHHHCILPGLLWTPNVSTYPFCYPEPGALPHSECPRLPCIQTYLRFLWLLPSISERTVCDTASSASLTHTGVSPSLFSLNWVVLPYFTLQEFINYTFRMISVIRKAKPVPHPNLLWLSYFFLYLFI